MLVRPVPGMLQELVTRQVVLLDSLLGQLLHHLGLSGYRGMVGARHPQRVLALHTGTTHQYVLYRVVQHVSHVQHTCHVGGRYHDGVRFTPVGLTCEQLVVQPVLIPLPFDLFRVIFTC